MAGQVNAEELQRLIAQGAQVVEVLPEEEYGELRIQGATNLPLKQLDPESVEALDRERPVVVYCWDSL